MDKQAYPQMHMYRTPKEPFDLNKWKDVAIKVKMAARQYPEYAQKQIIAHFTHDWDYQERESFEKWFDYRQSPDAAKYKKGQDMSMKKVAYDFSGQKEDRLQELKKKLRSRVTSAERLLNKITDEGLLPDEEKVLYIGRILQKLKEEINMLKRPQLIEARHKRAGTLLRKAKFEEGAEILEESVAIIEAARQGRLIKTAEADTRAVLEAIKDELDMFDYAYHLRRLMSIAGTLEKLGRHSEAADVITVIKKELSGVDSIHKKLADVYLAVGQIPRGKRPKPPEKAEKPTTKVPMEVARPTREVQQVELPKEPRI